MAGFDEGQIFYHDGQGTGLENFTAQTSSLHLTRGKLRDFLLHHSDRGGANAERQVYSDSRGEKRMRIDVQAIQDFDADLGKSILENPTDLLPLLEEEAIKTTRLKLREEQDSGAPAQSSGVHILLHSRVQFGPASLRELQSECVSQLVMVPGIITAASRPKLKATHMTVICKSCKHTKVLACKPGMGGAIIPRYCDGGDNPGAPNMCGESPYVILPHRSAFVDQQTLKLQERPEDVPVGELPRSMLMVVDRTLVGTLAPGTRVTALGIYSIFQAKEGKRSDKSAVTLRQPYLRVVGLEEEAAGARSTPAFTQEEENEFRDFAAQPNVLDRIFAAIAPNIFGHERIKEAIACLLFGGSRKRLPDGTWRRGDINVLLLGDPSTAKSQFLKFASKTAPVSVYTSGKGSSAAGLTASVIRDSAGEFYLEGGAMVLADGGVVCIDEFDKMRDEDRVAIHEAMEQQTISIAKAGITTMLKYDDLKSTSDNIELQSTILSRFDLIFIVKDERNAERDRQIARVAGGETAGMHRPPSMLCKTQLKKSQDRIWHVLDVHRAATARAEPDEGEAREEAFLRRYLEYARSRCVPRLSAAAAQGLASEYVELRKEVRAVMAGQSSDVPAVPMTVRQLEAVVRLAEALARMRLQDTATPAHVRHAVDLFKVSTMDAVRSGVTANLVLTEEQRAELQGVEAQLKRRIAIGSHVSVRRVTDELVRCGLADMLVSRALHVLVQQKEFEYIKERRMVKRLK